MAIRKYTPQQRAAAVRRATQWVKNLSPKALAEFRKKQKQRRDGEVNRRKKLKYDRDYRVRRREQIARGSRRWRKANPERVSRIGLKYRYRLTDEACDALLSPTHCLICNNKFQSQGIRKRCIDHCHKTGAVRGVLCQACNHMLGNANDRANVLIRGAKYLRGKL